jgi:hypothetical protein
MTPADPPPAAAPPVSGAWTTTREVRMDCAGCGAPFVLSYKFRFVEGLAATGVRCPMEGCRSRREYYLPVNAFDVQVAAAPPRP